jgi:hypothetical protein
MPRARHTDLIARRNEGVRTLAVSPRGKAAGDKIMHKDAASDDRGPERDLVAESFRARLHDQVAHGAEDGAGRENRQTVAADQAQR